MVLGTSTGLCIGCPTTDDAQTGKPKCAVYYVDPVILGTSPLIESSSLLSRMLVPRSADHWVDNAVFKAGRTPLAEWCDEAIMMWLAKFNVPDSDNRRFSHMIHRHPSLHNGSISLTSSIVVVVVVRRALRTLTLKLGLNILYRLLCTKMFYWITSAVAMLRQSN